MNRRISSALLASALAVILFACGGGTVPAPATPSIYIECDECTSTSTGTSSQIQSFSPAGTAVTTITSTLPGFAALRADAAGNLYTTSLSTVTGAYTVAVFSHTAGGAASPLRTFTSPLMTYLNAFAVAPDGTVYFADRANGLLRFDPTASGTATPTQFSSINLVGMVVDPSGNLYGTVSTGILYGFPGGAIVPTNIVVYNAGFVSATPSRTITPATLMSLNHLAVDASGTIYASGTTLNTSGIIPAITREIAVFAPGAATPIRTITSSALNGGDNIAIDSSGNLYVRTSASSTLFSTPHPINILEFGPTANGNVTPDVTISTGVYSLSSYGIAVY